MAVGTIPYTHRCFAVAAARIGLVVAVGFVLGGCSMSFKLFGDDKKDEPATTASIQPPQAAPVGQVDSAPLSPPGLAPVALAPEQTSGGVMMPGAASIGLSPSDWLYARGALGLALTGAEDGPPVLWANPETGSRGSFRPASPVEARDGMSCRRFIATRAAQQTPEATVEGRACQTPAGQWDVAEARPGPATATL